MNQPRPESRISALEKRASTLEAQIVEMSADTAEELRKAQAPPVGAEGKAIRQDIKQLNDGMMASFLQIGDAFTLNANNIEEVKQDLAALKAAQEARFDKLEAPFDKLEATQDLILQLLQQKPDKSP